MNLITEGDFIDLNVALRQKGFLYLFSKLNPSLKFRIKNTWKQIDSDSSDWWLIPEVQKRWNFLISGNKEIFYQQYFIEKYFPKANNLKMLSVGCGGGTPEIRFAKLNCFDEIHAFDISEKIIAHAEEKAAKLNLSDTIKFFYADANKHDFGFEKFDVILFHSSLHHMASPDKIVAKASRGLKQNGYLIINEYTGLNRLQLRQKQIDEINYLLTNIILEKFRKRKFGSVKKKVYRSGSLRVWLSDPSESVNSEMILPCIHNNLKVIEEKKLGGDILHLLLKDIAHHFIDLDDEKNSILKKLFVAEDNFIRENAHSDFTFGIYKKK